MGDAFNADASFLEENPSSAEFSSISFVETDENNPPYGSPSYAGTSSWVVSNVQATNDQVHHESVPRVSPEIPTSDSCISIDEEMIDQLPDQVPDPNLLMDLTSNVDGGYQGPSLYQSPAFPTDVIPVSSSKEDMDVYPEASLLSNACGGLPGANFDVEDRGFRSLACPSGGYYRPFHTFEQDVTAGNWCQQPYKQESSSIPQDQTDEARLRIGPTMGMEFQHASEYDEYGALGHQHHVSSDTAWPKQIGRLAMMSPSDDPWSPMKPRAGVQLPSYQQTKGQVWTNMQHPMSDRAASQSCSSASEMLNPCTPRSSIEATPPNMSDSIVTVKGAYKADIQLSHTPQDAYHSSLTRHTRVNDLVQPQRAAEPEMLSRFLGDRSQHHPRGAQPISSLSSHSTTSRNNPHYLPLPNAGHRQHRHSPSPSTISGASSTPSDPLVCDICGKEYRGEYRKGNLARHRRQKHGLQEQLSVCEEPGCRKAFKRQDARLKHYRKHHAWLAGPALSRKP